MTKMAQLIPDGTSSFQLFAQLQSFSPKETILIPSHYGLEKD